MKIVFYGPHNIGLSRTRSSLPRIRGSFSSGVTALAALQNKSERRLDAGHEVTWLIPKGGL